MVEQQSSPTPHAPFLSRVATAPISWGICEVPGWGPQMDPHRVLQEMQSLGFSATEYGSPGFFPSDPAELKALLASYDMRLMGGFVPLVLHDAAQREQMLEIADATARDLAAGGSWNFVTAAVTSLDWQPRHELSEEEWSHLATMLEEVDTITRSHGLVQVLHPHVDTVVETAFDVTQVLERSNVQWCFDTGHLFIGGTDPLAFAKNYFDRIGLVHLKDINAAVVPALNADEMTLMEATAAGIFCNLGVGDVPLAEIIQFLEGRGFDQWYVVEQDCAIEGPMPAPGEGPIEDVRKSFAFLKDLSVPAPTQQSVPE